MAEVLGLIQCLSWVVGIARDGLLFFPGPEILGAMTRISSNQPDRGVVANDRTPKPTARTAMLRRGLVYRSCTA
jgi:hypothetical protein